MKSVGISGTAGSVAVLVVWLAGLFGVDMPAEVGASIGTLLGSLFSLFFGREKARDSGGLKG